MTYTTSRALRFVVARSLMRAAGDLGDHWIQSDFCAQVKGATDDKPVTFENEVTHERTVHGSADGVRACAWHCLTYTATQGAFLVVGAKVLGVRLRPAAVVGALAVSGLTHYAADRRVPGGLLERMAAARRKSRFYRLTEFGMNGSYVLDQSYHNTAETVAAVVAAL